MLTRFDHIIIGAASLKQGVEYIQDALGVTLPPGGEHPLMGTHNHLMQLSANTFFEIIAINPAAAALNRPRWFGLDDPFVQQQLQGQPQLLTWAVNHSDINTLVAQTAFNLGEPQALSRGNLNWLFAVPDDGRLLGGGLIPYVLQWQTEHHPAHAMPNLGCTLHSIKLYHPYPDWLMEVLTAIQADAFVEVHPLNKNTPPYLRVELETPSGRHVLKSLQLK